MKRELLVLSIVEGSAVMIAELCGARLLAPVFGSSLYVWASVMGTTLAALAAGYYFGGFTVQHKKNLTSTLLNLLTISALALLCMSLAAQWLLPHFSSLPFTLGVVISTIIILAPPIFLLGSTSAIFVELQVQHGNLAGKASGTVYAVSTLGGIISTFAAGFWLLPSIGLQFTLLICASMVFVSSAVVLKQRQLFWYVLFVVFFAIHLLLYFSKASLVYYSDGILGQVAVVEKKESETTMRYLLVNKIIQTEIDCASKKTTAAYLQLFDTLIPAVTGVKTALVLGLGGGVNANTLIKKGFKTTAVEFDDRIVQCAKNYFFLNPNVDVEIKDARYFINTCSKKFDVIVADLYRAEEQPAHLFTVESFTAIKQLLPQNGRLYISWHGYLNSEKGRGTGVLINTLKAAGYTVALHSNGSDEDTRNLIIEAGVSGLSETENLFAIQVPANLTPQLNTDNNLCLERYNAAANESWRQLYLAYYKQHELY